MFAQNYSKEKDLVFLWILLLKLKRRKNAHRALIFMELRASFCLCRSKKTGTPSSPKCTVNWKCCFSLAPRLNSSSDTTDLESWAKFLKCNSSFYCTDSCKVTIASEDDSSLFPALASCLFCFPTTTHEACAELCSSCSLCHLQDSVQDSCPPSCSDGHQTLQKPLCRIFILSFPCITWTSIHMPPRLNTVSQLLNVLLLFHHSLDKQTTSLFEMWTQSIRSTSKWWMSLMLKRCILFVSAKVIYSWKCV